MQPLKEVLTALNSFEVRWWFFFSVHSFICYEWIVDLTKSCNVPLPFEINICLYNAKYSFNLRYF